MTSTIFQKTAFHKIADALHAALIATRGLSTPSESFGREAMAIDAAFDLADAGLAAGGLESLRAVDSNFVCHSPNSRSKKTELAHQVFGCQKPIYRLSVVHERSTHSP